MSKLLILGSLALFALGVCLAAAAEDQPAKVAGDWQISWHVRLGTEPGTLHLQQDGFKLSGTWRGLHNSSALSGTIQGHKISFIVQFPGPPPYAYTFTGTLDGEKITGASKVQNVAEIEAHLGSGVRLPQADYPWTATRPVSPQSAASAKEPSRSGSPN